MAKFKQAFKNGSSKTYKNINNAQRVVNGIIEELKDIDSVEGIKYLFTVDVHNRISIVFLMDNVDFNPFFHFLVESGHCVHVR